MEGRRRPRKSLLMYDKVLFFSALILLAFTLIYALDWIITSATLGGSDSFNAAGKVVSMAKRLNVYFIFIVIAFVTTTLALIYTILLRSGKRRNTKTLDNVMIGFGLLFTFIDFFAMMKFRRILKVIAKAMDSLGGMLGLGMSSDFDPEYVPVFGLIIGLLALISLIIGCVLLYKKIYKRVRPKDLSRQINAVGRGVSGAANAVKETAQNAADDLRNPDNVEDYDTRRPAPREYVDDDYGVYDEPQRPQAPRRPRPQNNADYDQYNDYNKYNDNNQYNDYDERPARPQRPARPARPDAPQRPARPDAPQRPARPDAPQAPRRPRPQNEDYDQGNEYDE